MQINVERLSPVVVECSIQIPADRVKTEVNKAYSSLQRTARVKGFRPGKAPRHVLAHVYGGRINADVAQRLVDETLNKALMDKELQPLSKPAIQPAELKPDTPFNYKARFEVKPEIESVKWEGFAVKRPAVKVSDAEVDGEIERLRLQNATLQSPDPERPAKNGDIISLKFALSLDGKPHESGEQSVDAELGSGQIFPELEKALEGMGVGDTKDVEVPFPDTHANAAFRGKTGTFAIKVEEIKERVLADVDDEFAKDLGDYENLAALKTSIKERFEKEAKQRADDAVAEQLVAELCKANPIPVPPSLVEQQANVTERELLNNARRAGQRINVNADMKARIRADADMKVRAGLLMAEVAKLKSVKVEDPDLERGYTELAEQTGKNVAKLKAEYRDPQRREMLIAMILEDKILTLIEDAANVSEGDPTAEAPAEKAEEASK